MSTDAAPNFDLAIIYDTGDAFEKVAAAGGAAERPTLADYAVFLVHGEEPPEEGLDLEKVAEAHEFLVENDRAGRAYAQQVFSQLEDAFLQGDEQAGTLMAQMFDGLDGGRVEQDKVAEAVRSELQRRLAAAGGPEKRAFAGRVAAHYAERLGTARARSAMNLLGNAAPTAGQKALATVKGFGREFAPEAAGAAAVGGAAVAGHQLGKNKKTTVVYR